MHAIDETYGAPFDFPIWEDAPKVDYMLASLPRSGSTYIAMTLWQSGAMGAPMEYLNKLYMDMFWEKTPSPEEMGAYWQAVRSRRTSPNGVFGFKMFMTNYMECAKECAPFLANIAPTHVIYLTREDEIEQAVSYSKAIQSRVWFEGAEATTEPVYDVAHIRHCLAMIERQKVFWEDLFELTEAVVLRLSYEECLRDMGGVLAAIRNFLGVQAGGNPVSLPSLRKQRNDQSTVWLERFRAEQHDAVPEMS